MASARQQGEVPSSVLIIGSGVFGLSTAWALCKNPSFRSTQITLIDRHPFPAPDSSSVRQSTISLQSTRSISSKSYFPLSPSLFHVYTHTRHFLFSDFPQLPSPPTPKPQIDTSRIVRPDYASLPYTKLATAAQALWRTTFAPQHYHQTGLCVTASGPEQKYVSESLRNVQAIGADRVEELRSPAEIQRVCGLESNGPAEGNPAPGAGSVGYVNWSSGWADAEGAMRWLRRELEKLNRVHFVTCTVKRLNIDHATNSVSGATLDDGSALEASLTIVAAGAWSPALLDLRGICKSTGQALVYLPISDSEQAALGDKPTLLNLSTGLFMITPSRNMLKIARHGHGYTNPTTVPHPEAPPSTTSEDIITVSLPYAHIDDKAQDILPLEAQKECRAFLSAIHPSLSKPSRPWTKTRICWYTDTPKGDFLIDYHPKYKGLFVATGGSGHAFKFLPVIGDRIVECILGRTPEEFRGKWNWPTESVPEELWEGDGSRGGPVGMVLREEMDKSRREKL